MYFVYKKFRNFFIYLIAFGYIIFEEIFWVKIAKPFYKYIEKYHMYELFLNYVQFKMNRYIILFLFLMLFGVSETLGPIAFGYLLGGQIILSIVLYAVKMIPLVVAFAIFERGKEKLFSFNWFKISYMFIMKWIDKLKESKIFKNIKTKTLFFKKVIASKFRSEKKNLHVELFKEAKESIEKRN